MSPDKLDNPPGNRPDHPPDHPLDIHLDTRLDHLTVERDGPTAIVTINRPRVLNAMNARTLDELRRTIVELGQDAAVRVVIITGAGDKAFVAGADIGEIAVQTPLSGRIFALTGQRVFDAIENIGKPVIAAINGYALGGGCELAMACSLRLAADSAKIGLPEVTLGILPGYAGTQRLARLVGKGKALELTLTGMPISAGEAERIGLVNRVVPASELMAQAKALAAQLAGNAPIATQCILEAINKGLDMSFAEGCVLEATLFGLVASTEDMREGTRAFLEKRRPQFKGR